MTGILEQCSKCFFIWNAINHDEKCPFCGSDPLDDDDELAEDEGELIHA